MEPMDVDRASCMEIDPALIALSNQGSPSRPPAVLGSQALSSESDSNIGASRSQRSRRHQDASPYPCVSRPSSSSPHPAVVSSAPGTNYQTLSVRQLQQLCRERKIKVGGKKADLITRLSVCDGAPSTPSQSGPDLRVLQAPVPCMPPITASASHASVVPASPNIMASAAATQMGNPSELCSSAQQLDDVEALAMRDVDTLVQSFQDAYNGRDKEEETINDNEFEEDEADAEFIANSMASGPRHDKIIAAKAFADMFILATRRKSGQQTEKSVLNIWKRWLTSAIASDLVPDMIIDAHHIIEYLKYTGTRKLLTRSGQERGTGGCLSASSLKKTMTMLGRVRRRQVDDDPALENARPAFTPRIADFYKALMVQAQRVRLERKDFDITENTILDQQLFPEHFEQIKKSTFMHLTQLPSIIKAHLCWTWQCTTLNRGDELVNLPLSFIQPYKIFIPDYTTADGRRSGKGSFFFGVLSLYHETKVARPGKQEPDYNFFLPHKDPLRCAVGALAIQLHYQFDQEGLAGKIKDWDWSQVSTWRNIKLIFGKHVGQASSGDALRKMYTNMLEPTSITTKKKLHLARRTMPTVMEDMGVHADEIDAVGHWEGNTRREIYASKIPKSAVCALAGFCVGEQYNVPWATVDIPAELQMQLFPFVEDALARLRSDPGVLNYGTVNFLELLQLLRPYAWRVLASIHQEFPESAILKRLKVLDSSEAKAFIAQWPQARQAAEAATQLDIAISSSFRESATQNAFLSLVNHQRSSEVAMEAHFDTVLSHCSQLLRRTEPLSPSKQTNSSSSMVTSTPSGGLKTHHNPALSGVESAAGLPGAENQADELPTASVPPPEPTMPSTTRARAIHTPAFSPMKLVPVIITHAGKAFHVLLLSPTIPAAYRTGRDLIIPAPAAFCDPMSLAAPQFPAFSHANCNWSAVFEMVKQPALLWACWQPRNIGEYSSIKELWAAWHEGTAIEGVGRMPPLQLVEEEWGGTRDNRTKRGHRQAWRPHNDNNVRRQWSQFMFFVTQVRAVMDNGKNVSQAVHELDEKRGALSLPQFHARTRPKGRQNVAAHHQAAQAPSESPVASLAPA